MSKLPDFLKQKKEQPKKMIRRDAFNPVIKERDMKLEARDMGSHGIQHFLNEDEK
jgi:hypothetical protein